MVFFSLVFVFVRIKVCASPRVVVVEAKPLLLMKEVIIIIITGEIIPIPTGSKGVGDPSRAASSSRLSLERQVVWWTPTNARTTNSLSLSLISLSLASVNDEYSRASFSDVPIFCEGRASL